ncbi:MAG: hypothetical protein R6X09_09405 [Bacteroidales bacterium]
MTGTLFLPNFLSLFATAQKVTKKAAAADKRLKINSRATQENHGYETTKQALETNSAAELRGIIPSDFVGIVRLTNFSSLTPEI